ncbi:MAG: hypothetical protein AAGF11_06415 [Myxococcota bacterium]
MAGPAMLLTASGCPGTAPHAEPVRQAKPAPPPKVGGIRRVRAEGGTTLVELMDFEAPA